MQVPENGSLKSLLVVSIESKPELFIGTPPPANAVQSKIFRTFGRNANSSTRLVRTVAYFHLLSDFLRNFLQFSNRIPITFFGTPPRRRGAHKKKGENMKRTAKMTALVCVCWAALLGLAIAGAAVFYECFEILREERGLAAPYTVEEEEETQKHQQ